MQPFYAYILQCADDSYYAGCTDNIDTRMQQHHDGMIGYTSTRKPVKLLWQAEFETREQALAFEQQIKGWSRKKKEALIAGNWHAIQVHSWGTKNPLPIHLEAAAPQAEQVAINSSRPGLETRAIRPEIRSVRSETSSMRPETNSVRPEVSKGVAMPFDTSGRTEMESKQKNVNSVSVRHGVYIADVLQGQRRATAKAITLLESTRADHRLQADELLTALLPHTGKSFRLGISGVPGVGKSTFIEVLGLHLISLGHRVAVLAVDPSSSVSGGSILGDKTRMEQLSVHEKAFIRPSPSSGTLGGVASHTREAMLVCEAAGYDVVIVETVGVGQSEIAVAGMTDLFVLMQLPNAGDDLQAIKRGVMELADMVVINKADIDPDAATRAQAQITSSLRIFENHGRDPHDAATQRDATQRVMQLSALKGTGVEEFWRSASKLRDQLAQRGQTRLRREQQAVSWMWERIDAGLKAQFHNHPQVKAELGSLTHQVLHSEVAASTAARKLLEALKNTA